MKSIYVITTVVITLLQCVIQNSKAASPWLNPENPSVRSDITLLSDAGIIKTPITTWPLNWSNIKRDLFASRKGSYTPIVAAARSRLLKICNRETAKGVSNHYSFAISPAGVMPSFFSSESLRSDSLKTSYSRSWLGNQTAYDLSINAVYTGDNLYKLRFDGTYVAGIIDNWSVSLGYFDRWWGPGWKNSPIMSTNARPFPAISIRRNYSDKSENILMSWMGGWHFESVFGRIDRTETSHLLFWGRRYNIKPFEQLELSFSRTSVWGGDESEDLNSFMDVVEGAPDESSDVGQLAAFDFRLGLYLYTQKPLAIYGQYVAKNTGLYSFDNSDNIGMIGFEYTPVLSNNILSLRLFAEFESMSGFNIYDFAPSLTGYSNKGRLIGIDRADIVRSITLGGIAASSSQGNNYLINLTYLEASDIAGDSVGDGYEIAFDYSFKNWGGKIKAGMAYKDYPPSQEKENKNEDKFCFRLIWEDDFKR